MYNKDEVSIQHVLKYGGYHKAITSRQKAFQMNHRQIIFELTVGRTFTYTKWFWILYIFSIEFVHLQFIKNKGIYTYTEIINNDHFGTLLLYRGCPMHSITEVMHHQAGIDNEPPSSTIELERLKYTVEKIEHAVCRLEQKTAEVLFKFMRLSNSVFRDFVKSLQGLYVCVCACVAKLSAFEWCHMSEWKWYVHYRLGAVQSREE